MNQGKPASPVGDYYLDVEEDFEEVYKDVGCRPDPFGTGTIPVGLCRRMCTLEEIDERMRQRRVHKFEAIPNTNPPQLDLKLAMKEFRRSAAGREFTHATNLRPWSILKQSLRHLLLNICIREDDWMLICDFVFDRLKAVRQDMVIQRIEGNRCIEILEGSVRFLVYSMYRLTCTIKDFTEDTSFKVILSPEGAPVSGLNNYEVNVVREMKLTMQCLRDCLHSLIVQYQDYVPDSPNRPLFEAINLIVNLPFMHGHQFCGTDYLRKSELRNSNPMFKTVFRMYRDHLIGNHLGALSYLPSLREYPLIVLAYGPVIAQLQVVMMTVLKRYHSSRGSNNAHPEYLSNLLCPNWLDVSYDERLIFSIFMAVQFNVYNDKQDCIDFNQETVKRNAINEAINRPGSCVYKEAEGDSETRIYAKQFVTGRNWSFYQEVLKVYGLENVLDPTNVL